MKTTSTVPREQANRDVNEAIAHYLDEHAEKAALGFIDALERAYIQINRHPAIESSRCAHELKLQSLRSWRLNRFQYLVFYVKQQDHIDVWRVLQWQRVIPTWMQDPEKT